MIKIENLSKKFDDKEVLKNINLQVSKGDFLLLSGANGSGKSLLMTLIANLDKDYQGKIQVASKVGLVFQEANSQILGDTLLDDVSFGLRNLAKKEREKRAEQALKEVDLLEKKDELCKNLSGGEKRRLALASILVLEREILILDEPFANLDYSGISNLVALLKKLKEQGKTIIILTHELEKILALASRFVILNKGEILYDGKVELDDELLAQAKIKNPLQNYQKISDLLWL